QRANALGLGRSPASLILHGVRTRFPIARIDGYFQSQARRFLAHGESPFYRFQDLSVDASDAELLRGIDGSRPLCDFGVRDERLRRTIYGLLAAGMLELHTTASAPRVARPARAPEPAPSLVLETSAPHIAREHVVAHPGRDKRQDDPRHVEL